ncbi:MAG: phosphate acetyltransferase [Kiritimatiellia bacterium]|nr:phosphate acetyltransferase [Kiritimatiellia bacterium]
MLPTIMEIARNKAKTLKRKICLTETDDPRNIRAAAKLVQTDFARPVLVGDGAAIEKLAREQSISLTGVEIVDIQSWPRFSCYVDAVVEIRKSKGLTSAQAREWLQDTCAFAAAMVCVGDAHGYVSGGGNPKGYNHNTGSKIKPALQLFRTAPGIRIASTYFIMQLPNKEWGFNGAFFYADCGLNINPTADQLADIAVATAKTFRALTDSEPRVGMISASTKGSAKDPIIDKVIEATAKAKALAPEFKIDGELQFDAAVVPEIGARKAPGSEVAGRCNILIFPDLNCGNTIYKATERLAGAVATGPLVQGLRRPFNDVSRGCSVDDIVDCAAMAAITEWVD